MKVRIIIIINISGNLDSLFIAKNLNLNTDDQIIIIDIFN